MPTLDLFIKSHRADFWLLALALETIKKNVTGYDNLVLLIPERDKYDFDTRQLPERTLVFYVSDEGSGWLRQQVYKLKAHEFCNSDFIMYSDSDAFFDHPVNLKDAIKTGKPEILYTNYNQLPDAIVWKEPTEKLFKEEIEFEYMRRLGLCYHRSTIVNLNKWCPSLEEIVMSSERFSEFNVIGKYAHKFENEKYTWIDTDNWEFVPAIVNQVWSHSSKAHGVGELHLREYIRLQEAIMKSFNVPIPQ